MKRTNSKAFMAHVEKHYIDALISNAEDHEKPTTDPKELFQFCRDRIMSEHGHELKRGKSYQELIAGWLEGIPLHIAFEYWEIIEKAEEWHECELTQKQKDMICEQWFSFMASKLMQLFRKYEVQL